MCSMEWHVRLVVGGGGREAIMPF